MPLYEYQCSKCGSRFSQRRSIDERDRGLVCPDCAADQVRRLLQVPIAFAHGESGEVASLSTSGGCGSCGGGSCSTCGTSRSMN